MSKMQAPRTRTQEPYRMPCPPRKRTPMQRLGKTAAPDKRPRRCPDFPAPWLLALSAILLAAALSLLQSNGSELHRFLSSLPGSGQSLALHQDSDEETWSLTLVNATHPLPDDYHVKTAMVEDGHRVDARIATQLEKMLSDCRGAGHQPFIRSSFRTREEQEQILNARIAEYEQEGYSHDGATIEALRWVAQPGTSEHELGLAVDINDREDGGGVYEWLAEHAHEYGFILRYPADKTDVTGISNEPWHYRYVGAQAASEMHNSGEVLEEYLGGMNG